MPVVFHIIYCPSVRLIFFFFSQSPFTVGQSYQDMSTSAEPEFSSDRPECFLELLLLTGLKAFVMGTEKGRRGGYSITVVGGSLFPCFFSSFLPSLSSFKRGREGEKEG